MNRYTSLHAFHKPIVEMWDVNIQYTKCSQGLHRNCRWSEILVEHEPDPSSEKPQNLGTEKA